MANIKRKNKGENMRGLVLLIMFVALLYVVMSFLNGVNSNETTGQNNNVQQVFDVGNAWTSVLLFAIIVIGVLLIFNMI